jgi:hypothetical protein
MGYSKIIEKYQMMNDTLTPFYIIDTKMEVRDCSQLPLVKKQNISLDVFSKNDLMLFHRNCKIIDILKSANSVKKNFVDDIELVNFNKWSGDVVFEYGCNFKQGLTIPEGYGKKSLEELKREGVIEIYLTNQNKEILVKDLINNRLMDIREVARGNFDDNDYMEVLLEISIANKQGNFVECYRVGTFSRGENDKKLMYMVQQKQ